jgi:chemotaxis protein methyltransferase CheR
MKETELLQKLSHLIEAYTGLQIRSQDLPSLHQKVLTRMKALKLNCLDEYYHLLSLEKAANSLLDSQSERIESSEKRLRKSSLFGFWNRDQEAQSEWKELTVLLTTSESYFFRDRGQFHLLTHQILPELIERQKAQRSLRIWSAGCSTGEEPYSIAILLQELIPDWQDWNLFILGTDLNQQNIEKAKRGLYSTWSFRLVNPDIQKQYFSHRKTEWELNPSIRNMVTFQYGNLMEDSFPCRFNDLYNMDLIICRNVFVYFSSAATNQVIKKFYQTLKPAGYLMTAHAELHGQPLENFQAKVFAESIVYQRPENLITDSSSSMSSFAEKIAPIPAKKTQFQTASNLETNPESEQFSESFPANIERFPITKRLEPLEQKISPPTQKRSIPPQHHPSSRWVAHPQRAVSKYSLPVLQTPPKSTRDFLLEELEVAQAFYQQEDYFNAIQKAQQVIAKDPQQFVAHYLVAQAYANLGNYSLAQMYCNQAIQINPLTVEPCYLLAHIAEEQGNVEEAKEFYRRIIYLSPKEIMAYLSLASLYQQAGDINRARKLQKTALVLLKEVSPDTFISSNQTIKADEILQYLTKVLSSFS